MKVTSGMESYASNPSSVRSGKALGTQLEKPSGRATSVAAETPVHSVATPDGPSETAAISSEKGVIRNLLAGHYQGVADVRLRINFHEELQALEAQAQVQAIADQAPEFAGALDQLFASTPGPGALDANSVAAVTEAQATFRASADAAFADTSSAGALLDLLRGAFEGLAASLELVMNAGESDGATADAGDVRAADSTASAAVESQPTSPEVALDPGADAPAFDWTAYLADLKTGFEAALADLSASLADATLLPPPSEPHGNGAAYEKFLAIYRDLGADGQAAAPAPPSLDRTA